MQIYDWLNNDSFYWVCALLGSGMFVIQIALNMIGIGDQGDLDDGGVTEALRFKWLTKQGLTGFLMMFGWAGLTSNKEYGWDGFSRLAIALLAGMFALVATTLIFRLARKLHSCGNVFNLDEAIGKEAKVYQRIPKQGSGKITIAIGGLTHELEAISHDNNEVPSFTRVRVIRKADDKTVIVKPI